MLLHGKRNTSTGIEDQDVGKSGMEKGMELFRFNGNCQRQKVRGSRQERQGNYILLSHTYMYPTSLDFCSMWQGQGLAVSENVANAHSVRKAALTI